MEDWAKTQTLYPLGCWAHGCLKTGLMVFHFTYHGFIEDSWSNLQIFLFLKNVYPKLATLGKNICLALKPYNMY